MASRNKKEAPKPLTDVQLQDFSKAALDPFHFSKYTKVIHPKLGKVPFELYPFQRALLWQFLNNRFTIVLKFRQAGVTELISMYCLWLAMYHSFKNVVIISIKDRVAKKVLRKIKFMYKNLPDHLKVSVVNGRGEDIGTSTELEFANGSIITSIPTTEDAGRSEAVSLMVIDEAAIVRWAEKIWAAAFPTLSTGGAAIINSTAYGVGNFFHKLWVNACAGGNKFVPIRLRWQMHPERDIEWYNEQRDALGPRRTAQEIDGDFLTSGNTVFDLTDIRAIEQDLPDFKVIDTAANGQLEIFVEPQPNKRYYIGADVSTGRSRDYSAFTIMDRHGEEQAVFKGKLPPRKFAKLLYYWGKKYNWAVVAPESNDIGLSVAEALQELNYPKLYYSKAIMRKKGQGKPKVEDIPGWYTTKKNRPVIIAELEEDIRNNLVVVKDRFFVQEAYTFIYDETNRPVAMNKKSKSGSSDDMMDDEVYTDDSIFGKAITNRIRKEKIYHSALPM